MSSHESPAPVAGWHEIDARGFTVVPSFLSPSECADLMGEWARIADEPGARANPNNASIRVPRAAQERLAPRLLAAMEGIASCSESRVDRVRVGQFYATARGIEFGWHNDHDAYFHTQDFINYLNFWIPIQKPDRSRSGVAVVPHDTLRAHQPALAQWLRGHGGITVRSIDGRSILYDSERSESFELDGSLDDYAVAPAVGPGDLVLMRGDVLHRTQDARTERVAVAFRCISSRSVLTKERLTHMGFHKFNVMSGNRMAFALRFAAFELAGRDTLTVAESEELCSTLAARLADDGARSGREPPTNERFREIVLDMARERRQAQNLH